MPTFRGQHISNNIWQQIMRDARDNEVNILDIQSTTDLSNNTLHYTALLLDIHGQTIGTRYSEPSTLRSGFDYWQDVSFQDTPVGFSGVQSSPSFDTLRYFEIPADLIPVQSPETPINLQSMYVAYDTETRRFNTTTVNPYVPNTDTNISTVEKEKLMAEAINNPIKNYKNYLTVSYDASMRQGNFYLDIFDVISGEKLGSNVVQMSLQQYNDFDKYATDYYESYCPILNRENPPVKTISEHIITADILDDIINRVASFDALYNKMKSEYIKRIASSGPDGLDYWLRFQIDLYEHTLAYQGAKKLLEDVAKIKEVGCGELTINLPTLKCHQIFSNIPVLVPYDTKYSKLNYTLSDALKKKKDTIINIKYPSKESQSYYKDVVKFIVEKQEVVTPKKLTEEQLIPKLKHFVDELDVYTKNLYTQREGVNFSYLAFDEVLYNLITGRLNRSSFNKLFSTFNTLKNQYMFIGQNEEEAVYNTIKHNKQLSSDVRCKAFYTCSVTGQYLPSIFLTPFKHGYISTFYALLHSEALTPNGHSKYYVEPNNIKLCIEKPVSGQIDYEMSVYQHSFNAMHYLTVRKQDKENTTITCEDSLYKPTPFMGIELEVQQQDKVLYMMPNGKEKHAPEDVVTQVYNAMGRDYIIIKRDGSLRGFNPFEMVTVPATLAYHKERWKDFLENNELKKYLTSYASGNCGMHIHISRTSFTGLHLAKFMRFINCQENFEFVTSVAQRAHNKYAEYLTALKSTGGFAKYFKGHPDRRGSGSEKYMAVNTRPSDTIEVRIFRGNLAKIGFLKNLEFVHAAWAFTKDAPLTNLTFKEFMFWLFNPKNNTKDYKELKMWLLASGWNIDGVVIRKTDTGLIRKHKEERRSQIINARKLIRKQFETEGNTKLPKELQLTKAEITSAA